MNKVVISIITTSQPTANPRAVKEAISLAKKGYTVNYIYNVTLSWADEMDRIIIDKNPEVNWLQAGKSLHKNPWYYRIMKLRRKFYIILYNVGIKNFSADYVTIILGQELEQRAKKVKSTLYIAHNLAALPFAAKAATLWGGSYAFDAEDFHRGESEENSFHWKHAKFQEDKYFPNLVYLTSSSPLISKEYSRIYPYLPTVTILNVFNSIRNDLIETHSEVLRLFWFSQKIGKGRGLEDIFNALQLLPAKRFSLTLLGSVTDDSKKYFDELNVNKCDVTYIDPVDPDQIFEIAKNFDIGLCLEPGRDLNNRIALSNKVFTYLACGNAVVFSDTPAQASFFNCNPNIGLLYKCGDSQELAEKLLQYVDNPGLLFQQRKASMLLGQDVYNWNLESDKLITLVRNILN